MAIVARLRALLGALTELDRFRPDVLMATLECHMRTIYSLIREIRTYPADHGGITPAIALTAYAGETNRKQALDAGYQKHLTKPADPNELAGVIARLAHQVIPHPGQARL
jgi:CheY-like chemotaxis protein